MKAYASLLILAFLIPSCFGLTSCKKTAYAVPGITVPAGKLVPVHGWMLPYDVDIPLFLTSEPSSFGCGVELMDGRTLDADAIPNPGWAELAWRKQVIDPSNQVLQGNPGYIPMSPKLPAMGRVKEKGTNDYQLVITRAR